MKTCELRYEGPALTGSDVRDLVNRLLVVASAPYAKATEPDLYFIEAADERLHEKPIKIGVSGNVTGRLNGLQTSCPYRLELKRVDRRMGLVERTLHSILREHRTFGEWFEPAPLVVAAARGEFPAETLLELPALDTGKRWGDVTRADLDDAVEACWRAAGSCDMWADSQRILRNRLARFRTVSDLYADALAYDATLIRGGAA